MGMGTINIILYVPQKKETHIGLKHEGGFNRILIFELSLSDVKEECACDFYFLQ